jgi:hypothetical protein
MNTRATTWAAWIAAVLVLTASGMASATTAHLSDNSCLEKNRLEAGWHRGSSAVSVEVHRGCAESCSFDAAGLFVAPTRGRLSTGNRPFTFPTEGRFPQYPNVIVELEGANHANAQALVNEAARLAGVNPRRIPRVGYTPNLPTSITEPLDDGVYTIVMSARDMGHREQTSRLLVALHEVMHHQDIERWGVEHCRRLIQTQRNVYELDLERRAFEVLQRQFGNNLPEETVRLHSDVVRLLSK